MAGIRAVLGILAGGLLYFAWDAARHQFSGFYNLSYAEWPYYLVLFALRILVWAATIYIFWKNTGLRQDKLWLYALAGALCSSVMDVPAAFLLYLSPAAFFFVEMFQPRSGCNISLIRASISSSSMNSP